MDKVTVLIRGYAYQEEGYYVASPTTTLIESAGKKVLVDPGTNSYFLSQAFAKYELKYQDIDTIFISHYHPDHFLNIRLFPEIPLYDGTIKWIGDAEYTIQNLIPETNIQLLPTPGHSPEHCSLLVTTIEGIVCVAQDVFWWPDGSQKSDNEVELLSQVDPYATDTTALLNSRQLVLSKADIIIPGHGKMFNNPLKKSINKL